MEGEKFGSNLGYFKNDTDDYSSSESYYDGNELFNEDVSNTNFLNGYKFFFGESTKLFNAYEDMIKKHGGKAFVGYPHFVVGILPFVKDDKKWHLTKPEYENTFYVVNEKDSKLIVAYFLCILSQIPVITNKFLKNLKCTEEAVRTKEIKTDDSNSSCDPYDFLAPVIPPELGDFPELKQPFAFKPDDAEDKKQIRFQIPSTYGKDQDLYKKFIRLIGGRVVKNSKQNLKIFKFPNGTDETIYTFSNDGNTIKRVPGELRDINFYDEVVLHWEWVKCMIKTQSFIQPYEYLFPHKSSK